MCDRPLRGFKKGITKNGKADLMVCSPDVNYIFLDASGIWRKSYENINTGLINSGDVVKEYVPIPCGSCLSCRIAKAAEMANRAMLELKYHDSSCFITLTYSDDKLITTNFRNVDTGEIGVSRTLFKKHYVDFIKRLRKAYPDNDIRYILCGEYGESTDRPHYHAIIFGYRPTDLVFYKLNSRMQPLYNSTELDRLWNKGFVVIGDVTKDSCNYVCRYVTKKFYSDFGYENYQAKGRIPPFIASSKRPAIGKRFYDDNKDWIFEHQISYSTADGGISFNAPRYFKKLRDKEGINSLYFSQKDDLLSDISYKNDIHVKDYNDLRRSEIGKAKERSSKARNKAFKRDLV